MGYTFRLCSASAIIPITWTLVAMVPLAKTPAWTVPVLEASRKAIMNDDAWASRRRAQHRAWLAIAEASDWGTPQDVKRSHPKASILKGGAG